MLLTIVLRHDDALRARDAILAGAWLGLGFALLENLFHVIGSDRWLATGAMRAATSVPGHVALGMISGLFVMRPAPKGLILAFAVPTVLHALYDWPLGLSEDRMRPFGLPNAVWTALVGAVLVAQWALLRGPVARALVTLKHARAAENSVPRSTAKRLIVWADRAAAFCSDVATIILIGAALAAVLNSSAHAAFALLAIMPVAFAHLWRRAHPIPVLQPP